ncbi:LysR family transcriptional regulator [Frigidibacter sp. RF13]|uniref:LysR family transcriptional regulator n=1 Tax=Frigidibacter sp. RF13 TaxID=2997340 RepID=UPI00226DB3DE|nr:LysR family transcriptional regulator [Frigidibacter sp. RF13]MCY1127388.1 LysR family transcriptional regulator [Frigidibacter sp. RF13]
MLSITLRQLEYAVAVGRTESMTLAAETLHVSQPALSVALAQLEAQIGQPLFLRRPGGPMRPTPHGRRFLDEAERILGSLTRLATGTAAQDAPVVLGCFEDLAPMVLAPLIAAARARDIGLTPVVAGFEGLADGLAQGRIDLALTYDLGLDDSVAREEVARVHPHAILAPDHPLAAQPTLNLKDLANEPLILADQGLSVSHMRALFTRAGLSPRIAHRTASLDLMRSFAANGLGIGLSYTRPAPVISYDGRPIVTRSLTGTGPGEPVVLARPEGLPLSPTAEVISTLIRLCPLAV